MTEHDNGQAQHSTALLDQPPSAPAPAATDTEATPDRAAQDTGLAGSGHDDTRRASDNAAAEPGQAGTTRKRSRRKPASTASAIDIGDLPAVLHRHVTGMGPDEAVHAIDALRRLSATATMPGWGIGPEWFAQLGTELESCKDKQSICRLVRMLAELLHIVTHSDNQPAVGAALSVARLTVSAEAERAAARRSQRR